MHGGKAYIAARLCFSTHSSIKSTCGGQESEWQWSTAVGVDRKSEFSWDENQHLGQDNVLVVLLLFYLFLLLFFFYLRAYLSLSVNSTGELNCCWSVFLHSLCLRKKKKHYDEQHTSLGHTRDEKVNLSHLFCLSIFHKVKFALLDIKPVWCCKGRGSLSQFRNNSPSQVFSQPYKQGPTKCQY